MPQVLKNGSSNRAGTFGGSNHSHGIRQKQRIEASPEDWHGFVLHTESSTPRMYSRDTHQVLLQASLIF